MKISAPVVAAYECSFEQACKIYHQYSLRNCEPLPLWVVGLSFQTDADLMVFKLAFAGTIDFSNEMAIILPDHQDATERFLSEQRMTQRVTRQEILWVSFWDSEDQAIFDQAFARV